MKQLQHVIFILLLTFALFYPLQALSAVDREQEVRDIVTEFVTTKTTGMGWDVRIRRITISDPLKQFPDGGIDYEVIAQQQWEGWGNISVMVLARQKDRVIRNIPVRIEVEALADTVITLHQIERGAGIAVEDLTLQRREITQSSHLAARKLEEIVGKKARTTLKANQPVRVDQVEKVALIKSGQLVTIIAENGVLKISVTGKARSSGAEGDIIKVQNLTSLKEIPARVIDASTVQIAF
jgi:flagella basal body P-ring formation protein FlgA